MGDDNGSRNSEFTAGVISHVRKYVPVGNLYNKAQGSVLNPATPGQNGLANLDFGQHLSGLRTTINGTSSDTYQKQLQKSIPYTAFGG